MPGIMSEGSAVENRPWFAHGIQQLKPCGAVRRSTRANHRHERDDTGPACYELDRLSLLSAPHEPATDRTSQLQAIAECEFLCQIG
jgi:hypothetical protein